MKYSITKELFEAVMGFDVESIYYDDQWEDASQAPEIVWSQDGEQIAGICIHYLAHKCKEWALNKGFYFEINIKLSGTHVKLWHDTNITSLFKSFKESTEQEAIFKACQWILENKE